VRRDRSERNLMSSPIVVSQVQPEMPHGRGKTKETSTTDWLVSGRVEGGSARFTVLRTG